eukprot:890229-Prymnesium_polylepis.1
MSLLTGALAPSGWTPPTSTTTVISCSLSREKFCSSSTAAAYAYCAGVPADGSHIAASARKTGVASSAFMPSDSCITFHGGNPLFSNGVPGGGGSEASRQSRCARSIAAASSTLAFRARRKRSRSATGESGKSSSIFLASAVAGSVGSAAAAVGGSVLAAVASAADGAQAAAAAASGMDGGGAGGRGGAVGVGALLVPPIPSVGATT